MRVIVTGSDGFIGKHLEAHLVEQGHEVFCYDRSKGVDLCRDEIEFPKVDVIYHLAATNGTKHFYDNPSEVLKNNTLLNFVFDKYMDIYPETEFFFASTCEVFNGAIDVFGWPVPTDETVPSVFSNTTNPRWSYSMPKIIGENYFSNKYANVKILRYFNVFGERQRDHFIPEFIERCLTASKYELFGDDTRAFCYVKDAVKLTTGLQNKPSGIYNIGCSEERRISEIAKIILTHLGKTEESFSIYPSPTGSVSRRCPDTKKVLDAVGNFEYTPLDLALAKTVKWYVENG